MSIEEPQIVTKEESAESTSQEITPPDKKVVPVLFVQQGSAKDDSTTAESTNTATASANPLHSIANGKLIPVTGPNNIAYVGTLFKAVVKGQDCIQQKVLLAPMKSKDGAVARIILPRTTQTTASTTPTTLTSPSLSLILPQSSCKQTNKNYVVSPSSNPKVKQSSISILSRNTVVIDPLTSQPVQSKLLPPNIIRQKSIDSKIITNSVIKPFNILQAKKLLASSLVCPINLLNAKNDKSKLSDKENITSSNSADSTNESESKDDLTMKEETPQDEKSNSDEKISIEDQENVEREIKSEVIEVKEEQSSEEGADSTCTPKTEEDEKCLDNTDKQLDVDQPKEESIKESKSAKDPSEHQKEKLLPPAPKERARKRKGIVLVNELPVKVFASQQENLKLLPGAEEFDPFKTVEWDATGLGALPGCNIKMTINEFGMLEVHDESVVDGNSNSSGDKIEGKRKDRDPDEIYCCVACSCYGLISEFYNENYCSVACKDNLIAQQQAICNKTEQEKKVFTEKKKKKLFKSESSNQKSTDEDVDIKTKTLLQSPKQDDTVKVKNDEVIDLDDDSSSSDTPPVCNKLPSLLKKSLQVTKCEQQKERRVSRTSFKFKSKLESILPPNKAANKSELRGSQIRIVENADKTVKKRSSYFVSQDLDPGEEVKVEIDSSFNLEDKYAFPWGHYLSMTSSKPSWIRLFNNPFPDCVNSFTVNTYLEAIDPEHQSYFCAVKIVEVKGYRLRLHFVGYPDIYDFWVNADSPNIFPCGFCSQHGIQLQPPLGYQKSFNWQVYHKNKGTKPVPYWCFPTFKLNNMTHNLFKVGMKLEAVDKKNTFLVCVASVAGVIESRILIHFDSWSDVYDYWVNISSPYIHPVGWCKENNHELTPPNGYKHTQFSWDMYLKKTGSTAAPAKAFCLRPHLEFKNGTKLEMIDKRAPHLLRVATICDVLPYQVKVHFDGFPDHFGYWVDDDSSDLHPVGWGFKTGHPVEPPPTSSQLLNATCKTPGCVGDGNFKGLGITHNCVEECPYSCENINSENHLSNRLNCLKKNKRFDNDDIIDLDVDESDGDEEEDSLKKRWYFVQMRAEVEKNNMRIPEDVKPSVDNVSSSEQFYRPAESSETLKVKSVEKINALENIRVGELKTKEVKNENKEYFEHETKYSIEPKEESLPSKSQTATPEQEQFSEDGVSSCSGEQMEMETTFEDMEYDSKESYCLRWSVDEVCDYIKHVTLSSQKFQLEEIHGDSFLMLSLQDLIDCMGLDQEQASLVYEKIKILRQKISPSDMAFRP
ncbi:lethal(3)malignant brain tumor-like protein 3 [Cimex lectularius]|uniref:Uncharacterized protein n=1 Tax=Cimex lectularius TaxID=79782 RepID=A0A8I6R7C9_CIMLE|nr:lethal(3)malignant brain tumor-like protein 3 [Cimex lectularius]XP_014240466.1 lethal(3)malignant brain tumor-like protein 3 [Cimex lectularius]